MPVMYSVMILCLTAFAALIGAIPLTPRDVISPPITSPTSTTVWNAGEKQTVMWDISNLPPNITNPIGMVVLGFLANGSENLMLDQPLAQGFKITDAKVEITVPSVPTRNDYIIVLFGDSGNASPQFTINGVTSSEATSTSSSSATSLVEAVSVTPSPPITTANSGSTIPAMTTLTTSATSTSTSISTSTMTSSSSSSLPSSAMTSTTPSSAASHNAAQNMYGLDSATVYYSGAAFITFLIAF